MFDILRAGVAVAAIGLAAAPAVAYAATAPPGYTVVRSPLMPAPVTPLDPGAQISCPTGTVVWGGGAAVAGIPGPGQTINTSAPGGTASWRARVNNSGPLAARFGVDATCAKKPKGYAMPFAQAANPAHTQTTATATCPANTVIFDGGVLSTSDSAQRAVTSAFPAGNTRFTATVSNGTAADEAMDVFAVCGHRPAGYEIVPASGTADPTGTPVAISGGPACPRGTSVIGGGARVATPLPTTPIGQAIDGGTMNWVSTIIGTSNLPVSHTFSTICAA
jgi:hypothetical protein